MRKYLIQHIICSIIILLYSIANADNIMQINSAQVQANQQVNIQVSITNSNPFVAFQLDIPIPSAFTYAANSAVLNPGRSNGHLINATLLNGNILRIIGFSFSNTAFSGNSGIIATFNLNAAALPGDYTLTPTNAIIGNAASVNILTSVVSGTLTLQASNIQLNNTLLNFGQIPLGNTNEQSINITNTGNQNLQISNISFNSPYFTVIGNTTFNILPNDNVAITVRFTSTVKGNYQKIMSITSNDPDQAVTTVSLQAVAFTVNEVHCGSIFAFSGTQTSLYLSINNMEAFTGFQFDIQLPSALTYMQGSVLLTGRKTNHAVTANVLTGNILRIVAFSPTNQSFSGNDGNIVKMGFMVNGTGGLYSLNLSNVIIGNSFGQNIVSAFYNNNLEIASANIVSSNNLTYGDVSVLDTALQFLRVFNYGNDTLKINQLQFTNTKYFSDFTMPLWLKPGEYADIPVKFHSDNSGHVSGTMRIYSNDPDENPKIIQLTANGIVPNKFAILNTSCFKNDTITLQIAAENYQAFVGFQFDVTFPSSMIYINNSTTLTNRAQGHYIQSSLINPTTLRVVVFSMQQLTFLGSSGTLVKIKFAVNITGNENMLNVSLANAIMGNALGQNILYSIQDGLIQILEKKTLKLHVLLEGLYANGNLMNSAKNELGEPEWAYTIADKVNLEIRNSNYPYSLIETINANLLTNSELKTDINSNYSGSYYIVIKHRNHIETWSSSPVSFAGDTVIYDFTTAANKAYGDNQKEVVNGVFAIYTGDVNQDGLVDGSDMSDTETDNNNFATGYIGTDVNGDGLVDGSDMSVVETANNNFIGVVAP